MAENETVQEETAPVQEAAQAAPAVSRETTAEETVTAEEHRAAIRALHAKYLLDRVAAGAGAKNPAFFRTLLREEDIAFADDGTPSAAKAEERVEALRKSDPYLFEVTGVRYESTMPRAAAGADNPSALSDEEYYRAREKRHD